MGPPRQIWDGWDLGYVYLDPDLCRFSLAAIREDLLAQSTSGACFLLRTHHTRFGIGFARQQTMSSLLPPQTDLAKASLWLPDFPRRRFLAGPLDFLRQLLIGAQRRYARERRRRKIGRAYDMALEIARLVPKGTDVLDVGCGNGFIAHHLGALLGANVLGIDLMKRTESAIAYRRYDGRNFPLPDESVDVVLLCYVLHHAQDVRGVLQQIKRVLRTGGHVVIYEDIPLSWWDKAVCFIHNCQWQDA